MTYIVDECMHGRTVGFCDSCRGMTRAEAIEAGRNAREGWPAAGPPVAVPPEGWSAAMYRSLCGACGNVIGVGDAIRRGVDGWVCCDG